MHEIADTLERNAREVRYGSVSVELRIHEGKVVKTIYRQSKTNVTRNQEKHTEVPSDGNKDC
jgi:hypothetical protein